MQTWEWAAIVFLFFIFLLAGGLIYEQEVRQPQIAEELGIVEPTNQYELACFVLDNTKKIENTRHSQPRQARQQAQRNVLLTSFIVDWSAWHEIRQLADNQLAELTGPSVGFYTKEAISQWEQRLRPNGQNLAELDQAWLDKLPADLSDSEPSYEDRQLVATRPGEDEEIRQRLVEARFSAEVLVKEAEALKAQINDPLPLWVAKALDARAQADWLMLLEYRLGLEPSDERLRLEARCRELVKLALEYKANNYDAMVMPGNPVTLE